MEVIEIIAPTSLLFLLYFLSLTASQRQLRPVGEYDMSQSDAALLCAKIDLDKNNASGEPNTAMYKPDGFCFFFQWIYCPNVPEDLEKPCGWWEQKPCNYTKAPQEPHFSQEPANPADAAAMSAPQQRAGGAQTKTSEPKPSPSNMTKPMKPGPSDMTKPMKPGPSDMTKPMKPDPSDPAIPMPVANR